jgi:hypothetical protein
MFRDVVFGWPGDGREECKAVAVEGTRAVMKYAEQYLPGTDFGYEYSPEIFMDTELDFALDICEAVKDVISDTVYRRQKHPFLSPPATLNPHERLSTFMQDTLRGPVMASIPYFDQKKVVGLLDRSVANHADHRSNLRLRFDT